jgi:ankyrin repeat protein
VSKRLPDEAVDRLLTRMRLAQSPLVAAVGAEADAAAVREILESESHSDEVLAEAFRRAVRIGSLELLAVLLPYFAPDQADRADRLGSLLAEGAASAAASAFLVNAGANVNVRGPSGWTPLHSAINGALDGAVQEGVSVDLMEAKMLIRHGADLTARNASDETPLDIARSYRPGGTAAADELAQWARMNGFQA